MCMYVGYTAWYGIYERGNHQDLEPGITYLRCRGIHTEGRGGVHTSPIEMMCCSVRERRLGQTR